MGADTRGLVEALAAEFTTGDREVDETEARLTDPLAATLGRPGAVLSRVTPPEVVVPAPSRVLAATRVAGAKTDPVRLVTTLLMLLLLMLLMFVMFTLLLMRLKDATWNPDRAKNGSPNRPKKKLLKPGRKKNVLKNGVFTAKNGLKKPPLLKKNGRWKKTGAYNNPRFHQG